jgi:hypothetical protein
MRSPIGVSGSAVGTRSEIWCSLQQDRGVDGGRQTNRRTTEEQTDRKHQILGREQHRRTTDHQADDQRQTPDLAVGAFESLAARSFSQVRLGMSTELPCSAQPACYSFRLVPSDRLRRDLLVAAGFAWAASTAHTRRGTPACRLSAPEGVHGTALAI